MEAVARQFGRNKKIFILRNGWFSFRWTEIIEICELSTNVTVIKAVPMEGEDPLYQPHYVPENIEKVVALIREHKPEIFFCPHVETSIGIMLSNE